MPGLSVRYRTFFALLFAILLHSHVTELDAFSPMGLVFAFFGTMALILGLHWLIEDARRE